MVYQWRLWFLVAILALGTAAVIAQEPANPAPQVIEMQAANYEFTPSSVHVRVGDTVQLRITATDKEHGVRIKPLPEGSPAGTAAGVEITSKTDCVKFKKDETGAVEFIARTAGRYEFECCKLCGFGHGRMKGEIIVDP
jgi:heme/copper-type cytochrome/quinol oxidase subunit 2